MGKRVVVRAADVSSGRGVLTTLESSMTLQLTKATKQLQMPCSAAFMKLSSDGILYDLSDLDWHAVRDNDVLYASCGELGFTSTAKGSASLPIARQAPDLKLLQKCLTNGAWRQTPVPSQLSEAWPVFSTETCRRKHPMMHEWRGASPECLNKLHHPLVGTFDGVFAGTARHVSVAVLGDSVGSQLRVALKAAKSINPNLLGLDVVDLDKWGERGLSVIPSSVNGSRWILDSIRWPPAPASSKRLLLIGTGNWYNIKSVCKTTWDRKCERLRTYSAGKRNGSIATQEIVGSLDHDQPLKAPFTGTREHGSYSWARRYGGTLTVHEYRTDLQALIEALQAWKAVNPDVAVAWYEHAPQHFPGEPLVGPSGMACSVDAWPPFVSSHVQETCRNASVASDRHACIGWLRDWRNQVANPLMDASGIPMVPIAAALRDRGSLHVGSDHAAVTNAVGITGAILPDCTHWCHSSGATLFMAQASLNVASALLL